MKNKYRVKILFLMIFVIILQCGCWDKIELEHRAFVLGIGLDKGDKPGEIALTYQIALPAAMYGEEGGDGPKVLNLTTTSPSILQAAQQLFMRLDKVIDLEHARVLILGEELCKDGIGKYIDYFLREINMQRRVKVLTSKGKVSDIFEISPPTANSTSDFIADVLIQNEARTTRLSSEVDLLRLARDLRTKNDFVLARVMGGEDDDLMMTGAAVFKNDKMVGFLTPNEVRMVKWLKDDISKGTMIFDNIEEVGGYIVFNISGGKTNVFPKIQKNKIDFYVSIRVEGDIAEIENLDFKQTVTNEFINKIERIIEERIKSECQEIFHKAQNEYEAEIFDFRRIVEGYNYNWVQGIKHKRTEVFKRAQIFVQVDVNIRRVGLVK